MPELYLLRHGQTDYNLKGIVQGRGVDSDLNQHGRAQAIAFYNAYHNFEFERIYTSTLKRTIQTVSYFGQEKLSHSGFDELDWGIFEGKTSDKKLHKIYLEFLDQWARGNHEAKPDSGESPLEVSARQKIALKTILPDLRGKGLICMHGRAMRILICNLLGISLSRMDEFEHSNTSLYVLKGEKVGQFKIELHNDLSHLEALESR